MVPNCSKNRLHACIHQKERFIVKAEMSNFLLMSEYEYITMHVKLILINNRLVYGCMVWLGHDVSLMRYVSKVPVFESFRKISLSLSLSYLSVCLFVYLSVSVSLCVQLDLSPCHSLSVRLSLCLFLTFPLLHLRVQKPKIKCMK